MSIKIIIQSLQNSKILRYGAINTLVSIILFYIIYENINIENSFDLIKKIDLNLFLLAIFLCLIQVLINNVRWFFLINKFTKVKSSILLLHSYVICFLSQILPSSIGGEVYKIFINKRLTSSLSKSITVTFFEKYMVLTTLLFLILIANYLFNNTTIINVSKIINYIIIFIIISFILLFLIFNSGRIKIRNEFLNKTNLLLKNSITVLKAPHTLVVIFLFSLLGHINLLVIFTLLALSLGIKLNIFDLSYIFFIIFLFSQLPISIGGWGIRETSAVTGLAILGVHPDNSFAISTLFGLVFLITYSPAIFLIYKDTDKFLFKMKLRK